MRCTFLCRNVDRHSAFVNKIYLHNSSNNNIQFEDALLLDRWNHLIWELVWSIAAAESAQGEMFIDPCSPKGYSHSLNSFNNSAGVLPSKPEIHPVVRASGNFSECRSAAFKLLQKEKGMLICDNESLNTCYSNLEASNML